jgi:hypothetical protein
MDRPLVDSAWIAFFFQISRPLIVSIASGGFPLKRPQRTT